MIALGFTLGVAYAIAGYGVLSALDAHFGMEPIDAAPRAALLIVLWPLVLVVLGVTLVYAVALLLWRGWR